MASLNYKVIIWHDHVVIERPDEYEIDLDDMPAMLNEMSAACQKIGSSKVLMRGQKTKVNLSTSQIYDLGTEIASWNLHIAIVEKHDASNEEVNALKAVVVSNGPPIQFFDTEFEARSWLGVN